MIKDRLIVCIASAWDYDPTSKHHIMKILSRHNDILWINYHGSRRPTVNAVDLKDMYTALRRVASGMQRISPSMVQLTPLVIPGASGAGLERLHRRMLIAQIRRAVSLLNGDKKRPVQVWSFAPDVPYLVGAFNEERFVYYCVDEYRQFEGFDKKRMATAEDEQIDRADVVVTASAPLLNSKRQRRGDTVLVRHGVDFDHFASSWRNPLPVPEDMAEIPRPIFGYFGLIHHWVDCALLAAVARIRPHYSFVLLGDRKVDVAGLDKLDNVHLLGRRPYEELPSYASVCDAGLMLFADNPMTRNVNPVKMYEYLAAGLPVVSTPLPEAQRFAGPIRIAGTAEPFAVACDETINNQPTNRERISRIVRNETWQSKVEYLSDIVMSGVEPILRTASRPAAEVGPWQSETFVAEPVDEAAPCTVETV